MSMTFAAPRSWIGLLLSLLLAGSASAQADSGNDALYHALGGKPGITALMDDFVDRLRVDPRIGRMFDKTKPAILKEQLRDQVCQLSGGPCRYEGDTMKAAHADLGIRKADFNALVEVLQVAMDARQIPFREQNRLLALLAPMHRDIITR
jgi:hemoglobin